jgi:hypothetical protein
LKPGPSSGTLFDINHGLSNGRTPGQIGNKKPAFVGLTKSPGSSEPQILLEEENFRLGPLQMLGLLAAEAESPAQSNNPGITTSISARVKFSPRGENEELGTTQNTEAVRSSLQVGKGAKRLDMPTSLMSNSSNN